MKNANGNTVALKATAFELFLEMIVKEIVLGINTKLGGFTTEISSDPFLGVTATWFSPMDDADVVLHVEVPVFNSPTWTIAQHEGEGGNLAKNDQEAIVTGLWGDCTNPVMDQVKSVYHRLGVVIGEDFRSVIHTLNRKYEDGLEEQAKKFGTTRSAMDVEMRSWFDKELAGT